MEQLVADIGNLFNGKLGRDGLWPIFVFGFSAGIVAVITLALDFCSWAIFRKNVIKFTHGWRTLYLSPLWFLGAMGACSLGFALNIYETTAAAVIYAAVAWPSFLTDVLKLGPKEDEQGRSDDEQDRGDE